MWLDLRFKTLLKKVYKDSLKCGKLIVGHLVAFGA